MDPRHLLGEGLRWVSTGGARKVFMQDLHAQLATIMSPGDADDLLSPLNPKGAETVFKSLFEKRAHACGGRNVIVKRTVGEIVAGRRKTRNTPGIMFYTIPDGSGVDVELGIMFELVQGKPEFRKKGAMGWSLIDPASDPITDGLEAELNQKLGLLEPEQVRDWLYEDIGIRTLLGVPFSREVIALTPDEAPTFDAIAGAVDNACGVRTYTADEKFHMCVTDQADRTLKEMEARCNRDGDDWKPPGKRWLRGAEAKLQQMKDQQEVWAEALKAQLAEAQKRSEEATQLLLYVGLVAEDS